MCEKEFMNLNVGILKEFLEELPDDYNILVESVPNYFEPVMNLDIDDDCKEVIFKVGDLNE